MRQQEVLSDGIDLVLIIVQLMELIIHIPMGIRLLVGVLVQIQTIMKLINSRFLVVLIHALVMELVLQ